MERRDPAVLPHEIEAGHAPSDVRGRGFLIFLIGFVLVAIVVHLILYYLYGALLRATPKPQGSPLAENVTLPPEPRLQGSAIHPNLPYQDMAAMRQQEEARLSGYGWANRQAGLAYIPIERAMNLLLERGLPTTRPASQPASGGSKPGESP